MSQKPDHNSVQPYLDMLERLRQEPFNETTNNKLNNHPYLLSAEKGALSLEQRRAFVCEQHSIQHSDACSFAHLAGHVGFCPPSLVGANFPPPPGNALAAHTPDLFHFLLAGEVYASNLLLDYARKVGLKDEEAIRNHRSCSAKAQSYPSYWARLALQNKRGAAAAACAVNFPAWGEMCGRLLRALANNNCYDYNGKKEDDPGLAFVKFFSTPIDDLAIMAATVMAKEQVKYEDLLEPTRLLQEYEVLFWDAIYSDEENS